MGGGPEDPHTGNKDSLDSEITHFTENHLLLCLYLDIIHTLRGFPLLQSEESKFPPGCYKGMFHWRACGGGGEKNSNMIFTYDFHIFSDSGGLPELMKGEMCVCVCVLSILGGLDCYRVTLLGAVCG